MRLAFTNLNTALFGADARRARDDGDERERRVLDEQPRRVPDVPQQRHR
jgi:hypothetical protein